MDMRIGDTFERKDSPRTWCVRGFTRRGDIIATFPHEPPNFYPSLVAPENVTKVTGNIYKKRGTARLINQEAPHE